jgi:broad specificity phosphatase PhoE
LSRIYLVRHGQAGTRKSYDSLSDLGHRQSRLLGEYFLKEGIRFDAAYRGAMSRQEKTAAEVKAVYDEAGVPFPEIQLEPGWNEFDLDHIYRAMAPQYAAADAEFRGEYEAMVAAARAAENSPEANINRRWMPCDTKMVRAWIEDRFPFEGESWMAFRERVAARRHSIAPIRPDANIVVFTSATPIGVWTALSMEVEDHRAMKLAGVIQNTAFTVIRLHGSELRLHAFNAVPHLPSPELRTHR